MLSIKNQRHSTKPQAYLYSLSQPFTPESLNDNRPCDYPVCDMHS